jgi:hypothetical protein
MTEQTENGRFVWVAGALCRSAQSSVRQLDRERREGIPSARSGVCGLHPLRARARQLVGRVGGRLGRLTNWLV